MEEEEEEEQGKEGRRGRRGQLASSTGTGSGPWQQGGQDRACTCSPQEEGLGHTPWPGEEQARESPGVQKQERPRVLACTCLHP